MNLMIFGVQAQTDSIHFDTYGIKPKYRFSDPQTGEKLTAFTLGNEREIVYRLKELHFCKVTDSLQESRYAESLGEIKALRTNITTQEGIIENRNSVIEAKDTIIQQKNRLIEIETQEKELIKHSRNKWAGVAIGEATIGFIILIVWLL